jgi:hypothetical protein
MPPSTRPRRLGGNIHGASYWSRGLKYDEVGNRAQSGRTTEGTILEIRLTLRMVVMAMVGRRAAVRRAELHQERAAARGHESHRDICAKQKRGQQYDGQPIGSPNVTEPSFHDLGEPPCQSERHCSSRQPWPRHLQSAEENAGRPLGPACVRSFHRRRTDTRLTLELTEFHQLLRKRLQTASP